MSSQGLAWAAVRAAYPAEPEESSEDDVPSPAPALRQYADAALQLLFGDLEAVWAPADEGAKQLELLSLPFAALKALLADERTRVASENTVAHTILCWLEKHDLGHHRPQAEELLDLVRVARLTPNYARTVFCESALAREWLNSDEVAVASVLPLVEDGGVCGWDDRPEWILPARPRSALADAVVLKWSPRLAEVEAMVAALLTQSKRQSSIDGPKGVVWQGWPLHMQMDCDRSASGGLELGLYLKASAPSSDTGILDRACGPAALIVKSFKVVAAGGGSGNIISSGSKPCLYTSESENAWGWDDFFRLAKAGGVDGGAGPPKDWAGLEAALRAKRLVHGNGDAAHLELRCKVTRLL